MLNKSQVTTERRTAFFALRMPQSTLTALRTAARRDCRSASDFALGLIQTGLHQPTAPTAPTAPTDLPPWEAALLS